MVFGSRGLLIKKKVYNHSPPIKIMANAVCLLLHWSCMRCSIAAAGSERPPKAAPAAHSASQRSLRGGLHTPLASSYSDKLRIQDPTLDRAPGLSRKPCSWAEWLMAGWPLAPHTAPPLARSHAVSPNGDPLVKKKVQICITKIVVLFNIIQISLFCN